jgi:hypothetical protein
MLASKDGSKKPGHEKVKYRPSVEGATASDDDEGNEPVGKEDEAAISAGCASSKDVGEAVTGATPTTASNIKLLVLPEAAKLRGQHQGRMEGN